MIISCPNCLARLQIDEEKSLPNVIVRCPKCNHGISPGPNNRASEQSALAVGSSPSTEHPRFDQVVPAPVYQLDSNHSQPQQGIPNEEAIRMLASLLGKGMSNGIGPDNRVSRPSWNPRKALVCTAELHREGIARRLTENGYQVYVADDTRQAIERMRANQLDVVLLEPQFDVAEQGAAFVVREITVLRPNQRRRLFFVLISPSLRTMDAHAAFLNNVNAVVNINDLAELPRILEVSLREFNDLYKEFNTAFDLVAI